MSTRKRIGKNIIQSYQNENTKIFLDKIKKNKNC